MVRITIDEETRAKLFPAEACELVEVFDESGKLLGRLMPNLSGPPPGWVPMTPVPTEEELDRLAEYDGPTITTEELLARLGSR